MTTTPTHAETVRCDDTAGSLVPFLGIACHDIPLERVIQRLMEQGPQQFCSVVTPNVDHILRLNKKNAQAFRQSYASASLVLNDSRVVKIVSTVFSLGVEHVVAGSDLVVKLLDAISDYNILLIGPQVSRLSVIKNKYPDNSFTVDCPERGFYTDVEQRERVIALASDPQFDLVLICVGSPVSEHLMHELRGKREKGVAICCGASIDFIVGDQIRAPLLVQKVGIGMVLSSVPTPHQTGPAISV